LLTEHVNCDVHSQPPAYSDICLTWRQHCCHRPRCALCCASCVAEFLRDSVSVFDPSGGCSARRCRCCSLCRADREPPISVGCWTLCWLEGLGPISILCLGHRFFGRVRIELGRSKCEAFKVRMAFN